MKVAYLVNRYPAISHSFIRREIQALEAIGIEVLRITIRKSPASPDPADQAEAPKTRTLLSTSNAHYLLGVVAWLLLHPFYCCRGVRETLFYFRRSGGVIRHIAYFLEAAILRAWLHQEKINHLHAHFGTNPATVAAICRSLNGPPFSFTVHGPDEFDGPLVLGLDRKLSAASATIAISHFCRSQLFRWAPTGLWNKVHVVHCGLELGFFPTSSSSVPDSKRLCCIGRLARQKGHPILLKAFAAVLAKHPDAQLDIIGDGEEREQLMKFCRDESIDHAVHFHGAQGSARVKELIVSCRCSVLASFAEGLPVVIMESLALGHPVISTRIAGIPELLKHEATGWLVTPGDACELAECIIKVIEMPIERVAAIGQQGRQAVLRQFTIDQSAVQLAALFNSVSAGDR